MSDDTPSFDLSTPAGERAAGRIAHEKVIWLTTVNPDGSPQSSPVWYLWDGSNFLVYSRESARVANIQAHPQVGMNLDGNGEGGDIVVIEGIAHIEKSRPGVPENPAYLDKYGAAIAGYNWTPEWMAEHYPVPVVITPTKFRYW